MLVPVFLAVSLVIFLILHFIPGDPVDNLLKVGSSPAARAEIEARYGLDQPLPVQYGIWLSKVMQGDLGTAPRRERAGAEEVVDVGHLVADLPTVLVAHPDVVLAADGLDLDPVDDGVAAGGPQPWHLVWLGHRRAPSSRWSSAVRPAVEAAGAVHEITVEDVATATRSRPLRWSSSYLRVGFFSLARALPSAPGTDLCSGSVRPDRGAPLSCRCSRSSSRSH